VCPQASSGRRSLESDAPEDKWKNATWAKEEERRLDWELVEMYAREANTGKHAPELIEFYKNFGEMLKAAENGEEVSTEGIDIGGHRVN